MSSQRIRNALRISTDGAKGQGGPAPPAGGIWEKVNGSAGKGFDTVLRGEFGAGSDGGYDINQNAIGIFDDEMTLAKVLVAERFHHL